MSSLVRANDRSPRNRPLRLTLVSLSLIFLAFLQLPSITGPRTVKCGRSMVVLAAWIIIQLSANGQPARKIYSNGPYIFAILSFLTLNSPSDRLRFLFYSVLIGLFRCTARGIETEGEEVKFAVILRRFRHPVAIALSQQDSLDRRSTRTYTHFS